MQQSWSPPRITTTHNARTYDLAHACSKCVCGAAQQCVADGVDRADALPPVRGVLSLRHTSLLYGERHICIVQDVHSRLAHDQSPRYLQIVQPVLSNYLCQSLHHQWTVPKSTENKCPWKGDIIYLPTKVIVYNWCFVEFSRICLHFQDWCIT